MSTKKDNSLILNEIKLHYSFKSNAEFASFLGIAPQTLSSWYSRNSIDYELLSAKCVDIDANWLLTGQGDMLKDRSVTVNGNKNRVNTGYVGGDIISESSVKYKKEPDTSPDDEVERLKMLLMEKEAQLSVKDELIKAKDEIIELLRSQTVKK